MRSHTTREFRDLLERAPEEVRERAGRLPIYSVRVDIDWRAVGVLRDDEVIWFWIGPHKEYERLLAEI